MKIRTGFVSNSSSSSFVIVISKEVHDKILDEYNEIDRLMINHILDKPFPLSGKRFVSLNTIIGGDNGDNFEEIFDDIKEDLLEKAKETLPEWELDDFVDEYGIHNYFVDNLFERYQKSIEKAKENGEAFIYEGYC